MLSTSPERARVDLSAIPSVIPNLIDGRDVLPAEGRLFSKIDPSTGGEICKVARSTAADVRAAVERARHAQPAWAATTVVKRGEVLRRIAILMQEHRAAIADLVSRETGKSRKDALGETDAAIEMGFFVAGEGRRFYGQTTTSAVPNKSAMIVRQPLGVAGLIIANVAWKAFPALLCGNAAIMKAAEDTPLSAWAFGVLAHEAGVPEGVYATVHGFGEEAGAPLVEHPDVAIVSFTGSCEVAGSLEVTNATGELGVRDFLRELVLHPYSANRYFTFPGGCVTYRYRFGATGDPVLALEADEALTFGPRAAVVAKVHRSLGLTLCGAGAPPCVDR